MGSLAHDLVWLLRRQPGLLPMRRIHLRALLDCTDRALRRAVQEARDAGHPIVADPKRGGYYYSEDPEHVRRVQADYIARIRAMAQTVRALERFLAERDRRGQRVLDLLEEGGEEHGHG